VRALCIFAWMVVTLRIATTNTVVVTILTCASSPHAVIAVTQTGKSMSGACVDATEVTGPFVLRAQKV
jgi:hypothetical protein